MTLWPVIVLLWVVIILLWLKILRDRKLRKMLL